MIKTLIFDFGGVCTKGHLPTDFAAKLSLICPMDTGIIEDSFGKLEPTYEIGKITPEKFWNKFKQELDLELPVERIQNVFYDSYTIDEELMAVLLSLKKTYRLVLLTNNYEDMFTHIKNKFGLEKYFEFMFCSSSIHLKKPEKEIYEHIINELKIKPEETIIVDDKSKNLVIPQEMGFRTIVFMDLNQLKKELAAFSVKAD